MKRIILSMALVLGTIGASAQLMYKISGNELEKPSYVVGTHRLAPAAMAQLINGISDALNGTDQMYGELNVDVATADASQTVKEATTIADGKTIQQLLSADELKRFNAFLMKTQEQDLRNRMLAAKIEKKTPAALTREMKIWLYLANHRGTFDPMSQIDAYFVQLAQKNNMPMFGMETVEEYANAVYKSVPENRQKEQMMCLVDNQQFYQKQMDNVLNGYMMQNMNTIEQALNEKIGGKCDATSEEMTACQERLARWAQKMPEIMKGAPTLFVIGIEKLPGENGILQLLRNAGYTVEGVK
ncbi:MAG: TraB/GumN family protein [Prevotella sp.]|nr:TraB/GumN family protein [Prevotella sp.]MBP3220377.1 TraB/GumN family protein [Prevotella sp.]